MPFMKFSAFSFFLTIFVISDISLAGVLYPPNGSVQFFGDVPTHGIIISKKGQVGIGTLNPASDLDVNGTISASSMIVNGGVSAKSIQVSGSVSAGVININGNQILSGYTLSLQALMSTLQSGGTIYFGNLPQAPARTAGVSKVYIRNPGVIKMAEIYSYSGVAGSNEPWSLYVSINNATDYLISTVSAATNERIFSNTTLNITVNSGDYVEIKGIQPTWKTNPATALFGGYLYVDNP